MRAGVWAICPDVRYLWGSRGLWTKGGRAGCVRTNEAESSCQTFDFEEREVFPFMEKRDTGVSWRNTQRDRLIVYLAPVQDPVLGRIHPKH